MSVMVSNKYNNYKIIVNWKPFIYYIALFIHFYSFFHVIVYKYNIIQMFLLFAFSMKYMFTYGYCKL